MSCGQFLVHFRMEADGDMLVTVQIIQGHFIREISGNDPVQELQTLLNGMLFKRIRCKRFDFLFRQVIDHVRVDILGLHGEGSVLRIDNKPVRSKALRPFFVREIDRRSDKLPVRAGRFLAAGTADHRCNGSLQVLQDITGLYGLFRLSSLVIKAVASGLQLAGLHASVRTFGDNGRSGEKELSADPAQMKTALLARCPSEYGRKQPPTACTPVFTHSDTVAVQTHRHTSVSIAGMDKVLGQIEILCKDACEHIVGFLVGSVCSPVRKRQQLFLGNLIGQQRRIVSLYDQLVAATVKCDMGLKPVAHQYVAHFRLQVHRSGVCIGSYCHSLML